MKLAAMRDGRNETKRLVENLNRIRFGGSPIDVEGCSAHSVENRVYVEKFMEFAFDKRMRLNPVKSLLDIRKSFFTAAVSGIRRLARYLDLKVYDSLSS